MVAGLLHITLYRKFDGFFGGWGTETDITSLIDIIFTIEG